jgi:hypothetical protein
MPMLFEPPAPAEGVDPLADHKRIMRMILLGHPRENEITYVKLVPPPSLTVHLGDRSPVFDVYEATVMGIGGKPLSEDLSFVLFRKEEQGQLHFHQPNI